MHTDDFHFHPKDKTLISAHLAFSFFALFVGTLAGVLQGLQRTGFIDLPGAIGYYQLLTIHGVYLALVFTTFFIVGFLYSGMAKTLNGTLQPVSRKVGWAGYWLMALGSVLALISILNNNASVLYTFYAPLAASPWFYVALALLIIGSWFSAWTVFHNYWRWRKENRQEVSPLFAFMSVSTMILWIIATLGVVVEVVVLLVPWAFGWVDKINVELSRTLFWYFGHPLVYFWLLPAYIWYVNIPHIIKGKIFSDALPRLTFILFILYSIPVGFHHQLMEPGISPFWKFLQVVLTMIVVIPSLMTIFSLFAAFELSGRSLGSKKRFGWIRKLPWKDVRFVAPALGMLLFIPAGAGGIINASYQMNQVVHNTLWVTGHFHLTLAASVLLTFFAISYWLVPLLARRALTRLANILGIVQAAVWSAGILLMGGSMHIVGLLGEPRRTAFTTYNDHPIVQTWEPYRVLMGTGSILLYISIVLFLAIVVYLWLFAPKTERAIEYPIGVVNEKAQKPPLILERWSLWISLTLVLILIAYAYPVVEMLAKNAPGSVPIRSW
ncbi:MAG: cbb3-type cytochrome c oxidase subunit I [Brevibacillus sp.]|nr:cbb3-type cytochrome c oxidase subunit I [Brevibacillus sp.]